MTAVKPPGQVSAPVFEDLYREYPEFAELLHHVWAKVYGDEWEAKFNEQQAKFVKKYGSKKRWLRASLVPPRLRGRD